MPNPNNVPEHLWKIMCLHGCSRDRAESIYQTEQNLHVPISNQPEEEYQEEVEQTESDVQARIHGILDTIEADLGTEIDENQYIDSMIKLCTKKKELLDLLIGIFNSLNSKQEKLLETTDNLNQSLIQQREIMYSAYLQYVHDTQLANEKIHEYNKMVNEFNATHRGLSQ